jgi:hypothetical protein
MNEGDVTTEELQTIFDNLEATRDPDDSEIEAYARMQNRVDMARRVLRDTFAREQRKLADNFASMLGELDNKQKDVEWWGLQTGIQDMVRAKLAGGKLKSVKTLFGPVGFRITPGKFVRPLRGEHTMEQVEAWAKVNCPDAITEKNTSKLNINKIPADAEQDLFWVEDTKPTETFYWKPNPPKKPKQEKNDGDE